MKLVADLSPSSLPWRPRSMLGPPALLLDFAAGSYAPGGFGDLVSFSRSGTASYFDAAGGLQTAAADVPRFDHDPQTGAPLGLLVEGTRTNDFLNSDAPATQSTSVTATAYTLSFYGTGTVTLSGAYAGTLTGSAAFPARSALKFIPVAGTLTLTVTGDVQYAQLEAGGFATSYIATAGATVTRAADVAYHTLGSEWDGAGGTLMAEFRAPAADQLALIAYFNSATYHESFGILKADYAVNGLPGAVISGEVNDASVVRINLSVAGNDGAFHKAAVYYDNAVLAGCADGGSVVSEPNSQLPSPSKLNIGQRDGGNIPFNGHIKSLRYYQGRLSDAQLQQITG